MKPIAGLDLRPILKAYKKEFGQPNKIGESSEYLKSRPPPPRETIVDIV